MQAEIYTRVYLKHAPSLAEPLGKWDVGKPGGVHFVMPHKRSSWLRSIAVGIGIFVAWFGIGVLFYQESPKEKPPIVTLLTGER